jgi:WD domain, G-beta repeat
MRRASLSLLGVICGVLVLMRAMDRPPHTAVETESPQFAADPSLPEPAFARLEPDEYLGSVVAVQFSPDGRYLAAGVRKPNPNYEWPAPEGVCIWDVKSRKVIRYIHDLEPRWFAFSPDSSVLAVCRHMSRSGNDPSPERMLLIEVSTGREFRHYDFAWHLIFVQFSRNGERLYYSMAGPVHLYVLDLKPGTVSPAHPSVVAANGRRLQPFTIDFCERNMAVACTLYGGGACLFQCGVQKPAALLPAVVPESSHVRLSPNGKLLATMAHNPLECFRAPSGERIAVPATGKVEECQFSADSRYIAYRTESRHQVHFLDPRTGKFAASFFCANDDLESLAFAPDGSLLATGTDDGSILLWGLRGEKPLRFMYGSETEAAESEYYVRDADRSRDVPVGAKVTLKTSKARYIFGEEIFVDFELNNVGRRPFRFETGGDYRGAPRHMRFHVEAIHADGEAMPDPHCPPIYFGGLSWGGEVVPGAKHTERLDLLAYRRLERPGRYRIRASHDFGWEGNAWKGTKRPHPVGETTIEIVEPTPAEAKALVEQVDDAQANAKKKNPNVTTISAYRRLTHPIYVPLMAERARAGSRGALEALGQMPNPEATKVLIELLDSPDPKFVADVEQELYYRLPDPEVEGKVHRRNFFDSDDSDPRKYLRDKSWRPEFAVAVRAHARRCLAREDDANLYRGAFMLGCVGTVDDLPAVLAGFDVAIVAAQGKPLPEEHYPRPPHVCAELRRAVEMMVDRGAEVPAAPRTPGEKLLFAEAISRRDDFRPKDWERTFVGILRDRFDYVREAATQCVPEWCPAPIREVVPELLRDRHIDVRIAALHLAERLPQPEWKPAVIEAFDRAYESWLLRAADGALYQHCSRVERIEVHIAKMGDPTPKMANEAVEMLTGIFHDARGGSNGINLNTTGKREACQEAWRKFVAANREKLEKRRPFSLYDDVPKEALFPGYTFSMPRRPRVSDGE